MSLFNVTHTSQSPWKPREKTLLHFCFLYFVIQTVPLDWKFYKDLFSINWLNPSFYKLFSLSRYAPQFFSLTGFANWGIAALLAIAGTVVWRVRGKETGNNDTLLYWLRVILRYRLAAGVIAYGFIKLFPLQMPYPSLSNLHTNYGDFQAWKIYYHTIGITQGYERFLGAVEILAGILLLFRKTVTFGAGIVIGFTGNVFAANLAYDAGEQVYSAYLLVMALFLFAYDVPRLYNLLALQRYTVANKFQPVFDTARIRKIRIGLKLAFLLFVVLLGATTYANFVRHPYKLPVTPGIKGAYGFYNVREFTLNHKVIPYATTDSSRWQNVIFEKWATISIKIAKPLILDNSTGDAFQEEDIDRNFESAGVGGRRYYAYTNDAAAHTLQLKNKNPHHRYETFVLHYNQVNDSTIIVNGVNERNDSISAVLDRINKKYLLLEGRRKHIKL